MLLGRSGRGAGGDGWGGGVCRAEWPWDGWCAEEDGACRATWPLSEVHGWSCSLRDEVTRGADRHRWGGGGSGAKGTGRVRLRGVDGCPAMWRRGDGAQARVVTRETEWHRDGWGSRGVVVAGRCRCGRVGAPWGGGCRAMSLRDGGGPVGWWLPGDVAAGRVLSRGGGRGWLGVCGEGGAGAAVADVDEVRVGDGRCGGLGRRGGACYLEAGVGDHR